ncbi:MAG: hypothetical protein KDC32_28100, partial [Saprospiraceae bacterium]|nr:hypothetical protein [Saprospiraceae bacterium]
FAAVTGTNLIESRRSCDGLDCDVSPSNQVSWTVNPNPTITSVNQPMVVCDAGPATIDVTGLPTSGNYDIEYSIGATTGLMANVSPNGSGEASFMTPALVLGDNGATLTVTKVTNTTTNCMLVPVGVSTTLSVVLSPDVLITADPSAATCVTGIAGIVLEVTGNMLGTSQNVTWSVAGGAATGTFTVNNSPALTTTFIVNPLFVADPSGTDVDVTVVYTRLDGCQDTEIITITIYPPVEANAYVNVGGMPTTGEVCTGGSIEVKVDPTFGFGQGDASQYSYQWALVTPTPPPPAAPIAGAVITDDDQQIATLQPAANAQQGQVYWIECTVTDLATCEAISNTVIITVVGPKEATISPAPGAPLYACSGDDIAGQFLIDVVDGMPNYTVTLRERNIGLLIDNNHTVTVNNLDQIVGGTVIFNNNTPNPIPLTYTIVSVFDADGCELVFPGGISGSVIVTWDPEPVKMTNVPNDPICSGDNAVIDVTTTVAGNTRFNWTASYGAVTGGANMATSVDFG